MERDIYICPQWLAAVGLHLSTGTSGLRESLWKFLPGVMCEILFLPCDLCGDEIHSVIKGTVPQLQLTGCWLLRPKSRSCRADAVVLEGWEPPALDSSSRVSTCCNG